MNLEILDVLAKGKHGVVYNAKYNGKDCVVKKTLEKGPQSDCITKEAMFLKKLNKIGIGPNMFFSDNEKIVMEKVKGVLIKDVDLKKNAFVAISVLNQCYKMDKLGVSKFEMTNPYKHIFVDKRKVKMIDFERCIYTNKPKNVTQFCEYLRRKGFDIDKQALIDYKNNVSLKNFKKIKKFIL